MPCDNRKLAAPILIRKLQTNFYIYLLCYLSLTLVLLSYLIGVTFYLLMLSLVVIFFFILFQSPVLQSRILASPGKSKVDLFNGTYHHSNIWRSPKQHLMRLCARLEIKRCGITTTAVLQLIIRSSGPLCTGSRRA